MFTGFPKFNFNISLRTAVTAILFVFALTVFSSPAAQGQTFKVLHSFTGEIDGGAPQGGVIIDTAGNLYGATAAGGAKLDGTVFKLSRHGSGWILTTLYAFSGGDDGDSPTSAVRLAPDGRLYGMTRYGGSGQGTFFNVRPGAKPTSTIFGKWTESTLYRFLLSDDNDYSASLAVDAAGNVYGMDNANNDGEIYQMTYTDGSWIRNIIYKFTGMDGGSSVGGLIVDSAGNLYGANSAYGAPYGYGIVFELTPSGSGWTESTLYAFQNGDGSACCGHLVRDSSGNLYGTTKDGGMGYGTVFQLAPSSGTWSFKVLYDFPAPGVFSIPFLGIDTAGNLYGSQFSGGRYEVGSIFKLTPSNGQWTYSDLYDFRDLEDGGFPVGDLLLDASGDLFGTTEAGDINWGEIYEITP